MFLTTDTIAEVVRTGSEFTAFVLEPYETTVRRVVGSADASRCATLLKCFYPEAVIVSKEEFVNEAQRRMSAMYQHPNK